MLEINEKDAEQLQGYADTGIEQEEAKQKYPALQLNQYKGLQPNTPLFWCFAEESYNLIPEGLREAFKLEKGDGYFKDDSDEPTPIYLIKADLRFIPLMIPRVFKENKHSKEISKLSKFELGDRTVAKLFLAPIIDGRLLAKDNNGLLIATLKLRSFKTEEIIGKSDAEDGTLKKLSSELAKKGLGGQGKSNVHFVNLKISPTTKVYKNKDGESNRGVSYRLESAKLNSPEMMSLISQVFTDELKKDILDPFRLDNPDRKQQSGMSDAEIREVIKGQMKALAKDLGWGIPGIKKHLQEMFGISESDRLTIEQLTTALTSMENLAALPSPDIDEIPQF